MVQRDNLNMYTNENEKGKNENEKQPEQNFLQFTCSQCTVISVTCFQCTTYKDTKHIKDH